MRYKPLIMALALVAPGTALAATEIEQLRAEFERKLKEVQAGYEARLKGL